ncbi:MAG: penicillin-binding protein 1C, partial [Rhodothermales bacterium]|nr:penicillin-binding protein 1C [Rhodothermales bacterium]
QVARALRNRRERNWIDKVVEAHLALRLELRLSKADILETWLNRVSFGNRLHGIQEASLFYFGKPARDLTAAEATLLVGLPQSPSRFNPLKHMDRALKRRQNVVHAAVRDSVFSSEEGAAILATVPSVSLTRPAQFRAAHFVDYVRRENAAVWQGAIEVRTTIDPTLQQTVASLASTHLETVNKLGVSNVSAVVLDNRTGNVVAYLGSEDYWSEANLGHNDGVQALRQPGSSLKPFAYAAAFRRHQLSPLSVLPDLPLQLPGTSGAFVPQNYDKRFHGPVSARTALACSYNIPAIHVAQRITPDNILNDLHSVGFASLNRSPNRYGVGIVLGNGEVTLLELARAYAALARGGEIPVIRTVDWISTTAGDTLYSTPPSSDPTVFDEEISYLITDILSDPRAREQAFGRGGPLELPFPCATKTGTSKDYRDNIAVGYTPRHTVAVWAGNFDGSPMQRVSGISGAGPLMKAIFQELGPGGSFPRPSTLVETLVCDDSGKRPGRYCRNLAVRPSTRNTVPTDTCQTHVAVVVDERTGELATRETPDQHRVEETLLKLPPVYNEWLTANGFKVLPKTGQANLSPRAQAQISFPTNGSLFSIDPVLRSDFQRIELVGYVSAGVRDPTWWIDDVESGTEFSSTSWRLASGWHRFQIRGKVEGGLPIRSAEVRIFVTSAADSGPDTTPPA